MKKSIYIAPNIQVTEVDMLLDVLAGTLKENFGNFVDSDTNGGSFDDDDNSFVNPQTSLWDE